MSITITYTDLDDNEITEEKVAHLSSYRKIRTINGEIKQIDKFTNNQLGIDYYIAENEDIDAVLSQLKLENPSCEYMNLIAKSVNGQYTIEVETIYIMEADERDINPRGSRLLRDEKGNVICEENSTLKQLGVISEEARKEVSVRKYFYSKEVHDNNIMLEAGCEDDSYLIFEASYLFNGTLDYISFNPYSSYDEEAYTSLNYDELAMRCGFTEEMKKYYFTDVFLPC